MFFVAIFLSKFSCGIKGKPFMFLHCLPLFIKKISFVFRSKYCNLIPLIFKEIFSVRKISSHSVTFHDSLKVIYYGNLLNFAMENVKRRARDNLKDVKKLFQEH